MAQMDVFDWAMVGLASLLGICAACILVVLGFAIYDTAVSETMTLRKDEWSCTKSHSEVQSTVVITSNPTMVLPMTGESSVCDVWTRK